MDKSECKNERVNEKERILTKREIYRLRCRGTWFIKHLACKKEQKYANGLVREYLAMVEPVTRSKVELISELIFQEIMKYRIMSWQPKDDHSFKQLIELLRKTVASIVEFKKELGIIKVK